MGSRGWGRRQGKGQGQEQDRRGVTEGGRERKEKDMREGRSHPIRSLRDAGTINFRAGSATTGKQRIDAELQALEAVADIL